MQALVHQFVDLKQPEKRIAPWQEGKEHNCVSQDNLLVNKKATAKTCDVKQDVSPTSSERVHEPVEIAVVQSWAPFASSRS